jgi:putative flavoprotein involved in K+ transport
MATGVSGIPNLPNIPTLHNFGGTVLHSSQYQDGGGWKGKKVLVIGSGNSGHDIAQDLCSDGAKVTLVQRSSTLIVNVEPSAQLPYALYDEGPSLEDCDLITASVPLALARKATSFSPSKRRNWTRKCSTGSLAWASSLISARTGPAGSSNTSPAAAAITSMSAVPI